MEKKDNYIKVFMNKGNQLLKQTLGRLNYDKRKLAGAVVGLTLILGGSIFYFSTTTSAAYLVIDGEKVGLVESKAVGENMLEQILTEYGSSIGQVAKAHEDISFEQVRIKSTNYNANKLSKEELIDQLNLFVEGYALKVDGQTVAVLPSAQDVENVIKEYKDFYARPTVGENVEVSSVDVIETINSEKVETELKEVETPVEVLEKLKQGEQTVKEYVVEQGDSLWLIARKNDMLTDEIIEGNPGFTEETTLQPGQVVKLVNVTPYLTVMSKGKYKAEEVIPFDVITKTDYSLASGQTKIKEQGSDGNKEVVYEYTQKNGKIVEKNIENEVILKKPVDQVIAKGPSAPKVYASAGKSLSRGSAANPGFIWPLKGQITSYYGWRSRGFHRGLDIDGETGQPIVAAAAGTVVSTGWNGGYGLSVLIDHGNGIATRYSHNSKNSVSVGQKVSKGQTIALVGSTGNSTGSHLDFEVITNGNNVNPLNFLP